MAGSSTASRRMAALRRLWRCPPFKRWQVATLLLCAVALCVLLPARGLATETQTPPPTAVPPATSAADPTAEAPPSPEPTIQFVTPTPLPSREEFFGEDDRTDVAEYENPAYTYDPSDDPIDYDAGEESVTDSYLGALLADNSDTVDLLILLTLMALVPTLLIMTTGFTRIVIVLSFTRNALGTQNMPPNQVIIGLSLFLTLFLMFPVLTDIQENALEPYLEQDITLKQAGDIAMQPIRDFMLENIYPDELNLFVKLGDIDVDSLPPDHLGRPTFPNHVLMPAFLLSELKTAFYLGFCIYIPFIVIDMIVASTLMSMGMMMLPPVMISLPFKILLFVSVDGWRLVAETLLKSFSGFG